MNTVNAIEIGEKPQPTPLLRLPKMKISEMRQMMMMWPARGRVTSAKGSEAARVDGIASR